MSAIADLRASVVRLRTLAKAATPSPWRDSTVDDNRYSALVADVMHPGRPEGKGWEWDEGYGGCLIGESLQRSDRAYIAAMQPSVAIALARLLEAHANEWENTDCCGEDRECHECSRNKAVTALVLALDGGAA